MYLFKYGKRLQNVMILAGAAVVVLLAVFASALFDTRLQGNDAGAGFFFDLPVLVFQFHTFPSFLFCPATAFSEACYGTLCLI